MSNLVQIVRKIQVRNFFQVFIVEITIIIKVRGCMYTLAQIVRKIQVSKCFFKFSSWKCT